MREMNLADMFHSHTGRQLDKWRHYFDIYEKHFARFRNKQPCVLEIGVDHGGSLQLWKRYFGHAALIVGVDIDPRCKAYEEPGIQIEIGDQTCAGFWAGLWDHYRGFDIVIDDGSHDPGNQATTFDILWSHTRSVYLIEDCHRAYPSCRAGDGVIKYTYPWVVVYEKPQRMIRGTPSRETRPDEDAARREFGP
jgi:hypothetical protein